MTKTIKILIFLAISMLISGQSCAYTSGEDAEVMFWQEVKDGKYFYYYNIVNNSQNSPIVSVEVGYRYDYDNGAPQLSRASGDESHIPLNFIKPSGWNGKVMYAEEQLEYSLVWDTTGEQFDIKQGRDSFRFGVELSNQRDDHMTTYFTVIFGDGSRTTKQMVASSVPPRNPVLVPIYDLLLLDDIQPSVMTMGEEEGG